MMDGGRDGVEDGWIESRLVGRRQGFLLTVSRRLVGAGSPFYLSVCDRGQRTGRQGRCRIEPEQKRRKMSLKEGGIVAVASTSWKPG